MHLRRELISFSVIGAAAFMVDAILLYIVKGALGVYWGRVLSFMCAVFFTWILNRNLTFKHRGSRKSFFSEFVRYFVVMLGGGAVNYLTYVFLVITIDAVERQPIWGVALGSCAGFLFNFTCAKAFVFKSGKSCIEIDGTP